MKNNDEVKAGLECCSKSFCTFGCTTECPYFKEPSCGVHLYRDAKDIIQFLEGENEKLRSENTELLKDLKEAATRGGVCIGCKHLADEPDTLVTCEDLDFACEHCENPCACHSCESGSNYEWKGLAE